MQRSRVARVHRELYDWLEEMAQRNGATMIETSRAVARDHKELQYYLAEKKKKSKQPFFTLRL